MDNSPSFRQFQFFDHTGTFGSETAKSEVKPPVSFRPPTNENAQQRSSLISIRFHLSVSASSNAKALLGSSQLSEKKPRVSGSNESFPISVVALGLREFLFGLRSALGKCIH